MEKKHFLKRLIDTEGNLIEKGLVVSYVFLLIQISLTSIFIFLEPKLYATFNGFSIKEGIYLHLGFMATIFLINLIIWLYHKSSKIN